MKRKLALAKTSSPPPTRSGPMGLLTDLRELIVSARQSVATTVNAALTLLHWQVGKRIREDILKEQRPMFCSDYHYHGLVCILRYP